MAIGKASITVKDYSNEVNGFGFYTPELTAGNVDDYSSETGTLISNVLDALGQVTIGTVRGCSVSAFSAVLSDAAPASPLAQNEARLLLKYYDTVFPTFKGRMEIPAIDLATFAQAGTDSVDLADTDIAALVTALEAAAVSKIGNPIVIYEGVIVGRAS